MAANSVHRRSFNRMQVVRNLQARESPSLPAGALVGAEAAPSVSTTSVAPSPTSTLPASERLPTSVKALAGFIVVMGVLILGIAAWRIGVWRRRKRLAAAKTVGVLVQGGKPQLQITRTSTDSKEDVDEKFNFVVPTTVITPPEQVHSLNKAIKKGTNRFIGALSPSKSASLSPNPNSPPTYTSAISISTSPSSPSTSPLSATKVQLTVEVPSRPPTSPHATVALNLPLTTATPSPVPSPRTSSYGPSSPLYKTPATARPKNGKKLPRLMVVTCTFVPSLADELPIRLGETVRLLEEYEDEWCLCQRVGKSDAEKGVIPRFCLQERQDVIASLRK